MRFWQEFRSWRLFAVLDQHGDSRPVDITGSSLAGNQLECILPCFQSADWRERDYEEVMISFKAMQLCVLEDCFVDHEAVCRWTVPG